MKYLLLSLFILSACGDMRNGTAVVDQVLAEYQQCCKDHGVDPSNDHLVVKGRPTIQDQCWDKVNQ
jgi:hypothetical protein